MDTALLILLAAAVVVVLSLVAFVGTRRKPRGPELEAPPAEAPAEDLVQAPPDVDSSGAVEAPPLPEVQPAPPEPAAPPVEELVKPSPEAPPVSRLARGLLKTRDALGRRLSGLTKRERLDDDDWEEVEAALIAADVGIKASTRIVEELRASRPGPQELGQALREVLTEALAGDDSALAPVEGSGLAVWLVTGVNGVGKTTSIAKLAHRLRADGHSVVLAAADTFRAAAIEQLGTWAERVGVHMVKHAPGADPGAVVFDAIEHAKAKNIDVLIVDTAGRLHTKSNLMEELKKVHRIAERQNETVSEVLLVLDATVGQNGIAQARTFQEAIDVTGIILTKLDGSAKGGIVIAVHEELGIPVKAVGVGESLDDLEPFDPKQFVDALVEGI